MIAIVDYGMGNLHSVAKAIERFDIPVQTTAQQQHILDAQAVILPGVGSFGEAMQALRQSALDETLRQVVAAGTPFLGICLGMQLLFSRSTEHGEWAGLDILPGEVVRFPATRKVPHMGWNRLHVKTPHALCAHAHEGYVYFVHSYHVQASRASDVLAVTDYGDEVVAIVGRDNVFGTQFHPEKSGVVGKKILAQFLIEAGYARQMEGNPR